VEEQLYRLQQPPISDWEEMKLTKPETPKQHLDGSEWVFIANIANFKNNLITYN
jgi:hypothetical protein